MSGNDIPGALPVSSASARALSDSFPWRYFSMLLSIRSFSDVYDILWSKSKM